MVNEHAEVTELVDVSDIEPAFNGDEMSPGGGTEASISGLGMVRNETGPEIAGIKERFSAFTIDAGILYALYWIMLIPFRQIAFGKAEGPVPLAGIDGIAFHGLYFILAFLLFVIPEFVFCASIGKLLCGLTIRSTSGSPPSFLSVLMRNVFRPLDLVLSPFFVTPAIMEWGLWHRRLGDLVSATIVLKKPKAVPRQYVLSLDVISPASNRALAFAIDLLAFCVFSLGLILLLNPEERIFSMLVVVFLPILFTLFFLLPEWITKTSPGKWIFGFVVCQESGAAIDLASALIRTVSRPFDTNIFGYLSCLFSVRHQRPGDLAAGTVVIRSSREWKGLISLVTVVVISAATLYSGTQNRDNFLMGDFKINFLPAWDIGGLSGQEEGIHLNLVMKNFQFAEGSPEDIRTPVIYRPGETVYLVFEVDGFKRDKKNVWLQEDLAVRYPDDSVGLKLENLNDFNQEVAEAGPIRFENHIAIPAGAMPGRYSITITIRDKFSRQELKEQRNFYIALPETQPATHPVPGTPAPSPVVEPSGEPQEMPPPPRPLLPPGALEEEEDEMPRGGSTSTD